MQAILSAEDDPAARQIIHDALSSVPSWTVTMVANGADLLEALSTVMPSLILLDVNMPGMSGIETYRLLRGRDGTRATPVLFITASPREVKEAALTGPHACLEKPFELNDLLAQVAQLLGEPTPDI